MIWFLRLLNGELSEIYAIIVVVCLVAAAGALNIYFFGGIVMDKVGAGGVTTTEKLVCLVQGTVTKLLQAMLDEVITKMSPLFPRTRDAQILLGTSVMGVVEELMANVMMSVIDTVCEASAGESTVNEMEFRRKLQAKLGELFEEYIPGQMRPFEADIATKTGEVLQVRTDAVGPKRCEDPHCFFCEPEPVQTKEPRPDVDNHEEPIEPSSDSFPT